MASDLGSTDVATVLSAYPALLEPIEPPVGLGNAGGFSGVKLWKYKSGAGPLVVRAWPEERTDRTHLIRIHGWVNQAKDLKFVPVPLRDRLGLTLQEHRNRYWEVTPWMPGSAKSGPSLSRDCLVAGFRAIASFHQRLGDRTILAPSPGLQTRLIELEQLLAEGLSTLERAIATGAGEPGHAEAVNWLDLARRFAPKYHPILKAGSTIPCRLQPCLRDLRAEHMLYEANELTGLVDYGAMRVDAIPGDLARLLAEWNLVDPWTRGIVLRAYSEIRPLDSAEERLIEVFEGSAALLGASHWIRWHYVDRRTFEDPNAVLAGIRKGLDRLITLTAQVVG